VNSSKKGYGGSYGYGYGYGYGYESSGYGGYYVEDDSPKTVTSFLKFWRRNK